MKRGDSLTIAWTGVGVLLGSILALGKSKAWLIIIPSIILSVIGYVKWLEINEESNP